jgi:hypothetical protein
MANDSDEIDDGEIEMQVWYVSPDKQGKNNEIVFDNQDEAEDYAEHVLGNRFENLDDDIEETVTIRRGKMLRSKYESLEGC